MTTTPSPTAGKQFIISEAEASVLSLLIKARCVADALAMLQELPEAAQSAPAPQAWEPSAGVEMGWLVENGKNQGEGLAYRTMDDCGIQWTEDVNKAIRFARRADAEMFAAGDEDAWRIVEHAWHTLPTDKAPQFTDCSDALISLQGKVNDNKGFLTQVAGVALSPTDYAAIDYLCDEWDFAFESTPVDQPAEARPTDETKSASAPAQTPEDGWVEWAGGDCPVEPWETVTVRNRRGEELTAAPLDFDWSHHGHWSRERSNIIAYKLAQPQWSSHD